MSIDKQSNTYTPATTGKARTFVIPGGARVDREVHYTSFMSVDTGTEPFGDVTPIRINDPDRYNSFIDVGEIRGSAERPTTSLIQKMPMELLSTIDRIARRGLKFDVHIQFGECYDPRDIRQFAKGIVYEFATSTSKDRDALVALDDGEDSEIRETLAITAAKTYEYVPLSFIDRAGETVINEITDVAIKKVRDCDDEDIKPLPLFAVTKAEGGSPGTGPYILWSLDEGATWSAHEVDTLTSAQDAIGVAISNGFIIVISTDAGSINYVEIDDFYYPDEVGFDPTFSEITTGLSDNPTAIDTTGMDAFLCGDAGYIYKIEEPSAGAVVLDAAEASNGNQLNDIAAFDANNIVAVGNNGTIVYATDGESFATVTNSPKGVGVNAVSVAMRYSTEWWVGFDDGTLYVTFDSGNHWTLVSLPSNALITEITDIKWASHSIGYVSATHDGAGRIYRTVCGGIKWSVQPQLSKYSMPVVDVFNALAVNTEDVNFVLAGGLGADGSDGTLVVGSDAAI